MKEIESISDFDEWTNSSIGGMEPAAVQGLDLEDRTSIITARRFEDCLFIGCGLEAEATRHIVAAGGILIPRFEGFEFQTHRAKLYSALELFEGFDPGDPDGFEKTWDSRIYREYCQQGRSNPPSIRISLARRLHDHSITDALMDKIEGRRVVAIMGGHAMERRSPAFAKIARISRRLSQRGFLMISGGGPGAMEATHVGAYFATSSDKDLDQALKILSPRPAGALPGKEYADKDWLHRAWKVIDRFPTPHDERCMSIGVPTWLHGQEPPTPFASHIAKYFANSVREDGLLTIARHGVIFAEGSAGTTQEIFQDAAQNHYKIGGHCSPMILLGRRFWTEVRPVWPLLTTVAQGHSYGELISLTDSEDEVVESIVRFDPADYC